MSDTNEGIDKELKICILTSQLTAYTYIYLVIQLIELDIHL